jgi:hypothetical protein
VSQTKGKIFIHKYYLKRSVRYVPMVFQAKKHKENPTWANTVLAFSDGFARPFTRGGVFLGTPTT